MHGSSDAVSLLVKGLLLGMSFGAAIYGEERGGKAAAATGLIRETAKALSPAPSGARTPRAQRLASCRCIFVRSGKHSFSARVYNLD